MDGNTLRVKSAEVVKRYWFSGKDGDSHRFGRRNVPDGDVLLFGLIVNGHVGGLVDLSRLQN